MRKNTEGKPEKVKVIKTDDEVTTASSRQQTADTHTAENHITTFAS